MSNVVPLLYYSQVRPSMSQVKPSMAAAVLVRIPGVVLGPTILLTSCSREMHDSYSP